MSKNRKDISISGELYRHPDAVVGFPTHHEFHKAFAEHGFGNLVVTSEVLSKMRSLRVDDDEWLVWYDGKFVGVYAEDVFVVSEEDPVGSVWTFTAPWIWETISPTLDKVKGCHAALDFKIYISDDHLKWLEDNGYSTKVGDFKC